MHGMEAVEGGTDSYAAIPDAVAYFTPLFDHPALRGAAEGIYGAVARERGLARVAPKEPQ